MEINWTKINSTIETQYSYMVPNKVKQYNSFFLFVYVS